MKKTLTLTIGALFIVCSLTFAQDKKEKKPLIISTIIRM